MAYTLQMPSAYYVMAKISVSTDQKLYSPFKLFSDFFRDLVSEEYGRFTPVKAEDNDFSLDSIYDKQNEDKTPFKYHIVGFIVALFQSMVTIKQTDLTRPWLQCQLSNSTITYLPMSIADGKNHLENLRENPSRSDDGKNLPFVFFVDECQLTNDREKREFRLLRNIMRCLRVCFVGMGTNTGACNFTDTISSCGSRKTVGVWCHLIHKLPKIAVPVLDEVQEYINVVLSNYNREGRHTALNSVFMNNFFDFFRNDRPLFLHYASELIERLLADYPDYPCVKFFWDVMDGLCKMFFDAKNGTSSSFIPGQLAYFSAKYWRGIALVNDIEFETKKPGSKINIPRDELMFGHPELVNKHLAKIAIPSDAGDNNAFVLDLFVEKETNPKLWTTDTRITNTGLVYKSKNNSISKPFLHFSNYSQFTDEPIAGIAFSLTGKSFQPDLTTLAALIEILKNPGKTPFLKDISKYNGRLLEIVTTTACMVSSHTLGFQGIQMSGWLPRLFDELSFFRFGDSVKYKSILVDSDEFISSWGATMIPYCCPQVSGSFSIPIIQKINEISNDCEVGVVHSNILQSQESRDFYLQIRNRDETYTTFLNGRCKMWAAKFGIAESAKCNR